MFTLRYDGIPLCNEALLGYYLYQVNVQKKIVNCSRTIIRMKNQPTLYGAKSLNDRIEEIEINGEISVMNE